VIRSIADIAAALGVHPSTVREARRENRLRIVRGEPVIVARRPCANPACQWRYAITKAHKLCAQCLADGWNWCCIGKHVTQDAYLPDKVACVVCQRAYDRSYNLRRQGKSDPPVSYIRLSDLAARLHYSRDHLRGCIQNGWMAGHVWTRGPRSVIYIVDWEVYPPFPVGCRKERTNDER
jgi:hypothetical protein